MKTNVLGKVAAAALTAMLIVGGAPAAQAMADDEAIVADEDAIEVNAGEATAGEDAVKAAPANDEADDADASLVAQDDDGLKTQTQYETQPTEFLEASWDPVNRRVVYEKRTEECIVVKDSLSTWSGNDTSWYVVNEDVDMIGVVEIWDRYTANLVLGDNATITMRGAITVPENSTLNIYCQAAGTGKMVASHDSNNSCHAGIGGDGGDSCGTITIHGGTVTASGGLYGAGIGGSLVGSGGNITIYGGTVTATGREGGAGIGGGGYGGAGGTITIYGGTVTATGSTYEYEGTTFSGAGIGGGSPYTKASVGATVAIYGGKVNAAAGPKGAEGIGYGVGKSEYASSNKHGDITLGSGVRLWNGRSTDAMKVIAVGPQIGIERDLFQYMGTDCPITYTFNKNAGEDKDTAVQNVCRGVRTKLMPNAFERDGYTFAGWNTAANGSGVAYDDGADIVPGGNLTLFAQWDANTYAVAFSANGHGTDPATQTVEYGKTATKPADLIASGYAFGGWYADKACTKAYDFSTAVTSDVTLYAKWTPDSPDSKATATLEYKKATVSKVLGAKAFTNELTNGSNVAVSYKSSNTKVAKVNKSTGKVTLKGVGTTKITATFAGDSTYAATSASYELVVGLAKVRGLSTTCHPTDKTMVATWKKVKGAKGYEVCWHVRGSRWKTTTTVKKTSVTIKNMKSGRLYDVRVRAIAGDTCGAWSKVSRRWYAYTKGIHVTSPTKGQVKVRWSATKGANKGYVILVRDAKTNKVISKKSVKAGTTSTVVKVKSGKKVLVFVRPMKKAKGTAITYTGILSGPGLVQVQ